MPTSPDAQARLKACQTTREISHEEARQIAKRFIDSNFNNPGDRPRIGIPARPDYDDDLLLYAYIEQQESRTPDAQPSVATENPRANQESRRAELVRFVDEAIRGAGVKIPQVTDGIDAAKRAIAAVMSSWTDRDMMVGDRMFPAGSVTVVDILDHAARHAIERPEGEVERLRKALETIIAGCALGNEIFEARIHGHKNRPTWHAVNVLQDHLEACTGTARAAIAAQVTKP